MQQAPKNLSNPCASKCGERVMREGADSESIRKNRRDRDAGQGLDRHGESGATERWGLNTVVRVLALMSRSTKLVTAWGRGSDRCADMRRPVAGRRGWVYLRRRH